MKRAFRFRLARIRRVREIAERAALATWASAEHTAANAEQGAREMRRRVDLAVQQTTLLQEASALAAPRIMLSDRLVQRLWRTLRLRRARARELRNTADVERARWAERMKDVRALEQLALRKRAAHDAELGRRDLAELDEWASRRHGRHDRHGGNHGGNR